MPESTDQEHVRNLCAIAASLASSVRYCQVAGHFNPNLIPHALDIYRLVLSADLGEFTAKQNGISASSKAKSSKPKQPSTSSVARP